MPARAAMRSAFVVIVALALGVLTAYAQGWLPPQIGSLANSTGSWALAAWALSLLAHSSRLAALGGALSLLALLAGYVVAMDVRGYGSSSALILFWGAAGVIAGPLLGVSSYWVKTGSHVLAAVGGGAFSGVLVGEGVYGLTEIADTTYPPYWWGQILVGIFLLLGVARVHHFSIRAVVLSIGVSLFVTAAFVVVYSRDLLSLLG